MSFVTYYNFWLKCYINLFNCDYIVADGKRGSNVLAVAILDFGNFIFKNIKKIKDFIYSFFIVTTILSSWELTSQSSLLLFDMPKIPTISEGMVVLNDFELGFCWITFDFTSNNFIPPFLLFFVNIFVNILYIIYPQKIKI